MAEPGDAAGVIDPGSVFEAAELAFEAASAGHGLQACYRVADTVVAMKFASPVLAAKLLPAFAHLEPAAEERPDLVICSWDGALADGPMTALMPASGCQGLDYVDGPVRLAWERADQSLQAYDTARGLGLFWITDVDGLPAWEQGAPFRRIFHWWSAQQGLQLLHGAAIGNKAGGLLLVGQSGSGKSTTALACVGTRFGYVADDYCLLEPGTPSRVHSLYGSGKADAAAIARLPHLCEAFRGSPIDQQGKSIIFMGEHAPGALLRSVPIRALVVPTIAPGAACHVEVLPRGEALRALAPSTLFQMPGDRAASLSRMSALIRDVPCFRLVIGNDPAAAQPCLDAILARVA